MSNYINKGTRLPPYMMFPRFLLDMKISETSKILYMVLLDRARLSQQNDGWADEYGHIFIIYTEENLATELHKGITTIKNCLSTLESQGLIKRQQMGIGNPNRIYVLLPTDTDSIDSYLAMTETEIRPCGGQKTGSTVVRKVAGNKNYINNNYSKRNIAYSYECKEDESL